MLEMSSIMFLFAKRQQFSSNLCQLHNKEATTHHSYLIKVNGVQNNTGSPWLSLYEQKTQTFLKKIFFCVWQYKESHTGLGCFLFFVLKTFIHFFALQSANSSSFPMPLWALFLFSTIAFTIQSERLLAEKFLSFYVMPRKHQIVHTIEAFLCTPASILPEKVLHCPNIRCKQRTHTHTHAFCFCFSSPANKEVCSLTFLSPKSTREELQLAAVVKNVLRTHIHTSWMFTSITVSIYLFEFNGTCTRLYV